MNKLTKLSIPFLITILTLTLTVSLTSAATTGLWSYGEGTYDMAACNIGIMDSGHVIIGSTEGYGSVGDDLWMFKVDNTGSVAWNKHYGEQATQPSP